MLGSQLALPLPSALRLRRSSPSHKTKPYTASVSIQEAGDSLVSICVSKTRVWNSREGRALLVCCEGRGSSGTLPLGPPRTVRFGMCSLVPRETTLLSRTISCTRPGAPHSHLINHGPVSSDKAVGDTQGFKSLTLEYLMLDRSQHTAKVEIIEALISEWAGPLTSWRDKNRNHRGLCEAQGIVLGQLQGKCLREQRKLMQWGHKNNDLAEAHTKLNYAIAKLLVNSH